MRFFLLMVIFWGGTCVGEHKGPKDVSLYALKIDGEDLQLLDGQTEFFTNVSILREKVKIEVKTQGDNHPATDAASVAGIALEKDVSADAPMEIFDAQGKRKISSSGNFDLQKGMNTFYVGVVSGDRKENRLYKLLVYRGLLPRLKYSGILYESTQNDGAVEGSIQVLLQTNDFPQVMFSGVDGSNWLVGKEYAIEKIEEVQGIKFPSGVPAGLQMKAQKVNATLIKIDFSGRANAHDASNSSFVDLVLKENALTGVSAGDSSQILKEIFENPIFFRIDFGDGFLRSSTSSFLELSSTSGVLTPKKVDLTTTSVTFSVKENSYLELDKHYKVRDLPKGLTVEILCKTTTQAELRLGGYAYTHKKKNSGKFIIQFLDGVFKGKRSESISGSYQMYTFEFQDG